MRSKRFSRLLDQGSERRIESALVSANRSVGSDSLLSSAKA